MVRGPLDVAFVEVEHDLGADHVALRAVAVPKQDIVDTFVRRLRGVGEVARAVGRQDRPARLQFGDGGRIGTGLALAWAMSRLGMPTRSRSFLIVRSMSSCVSVPSSALASA